MKKCVIVILALFIFTMSAFAEGDFFYEYDDEALAAANGLSGYSLTFASGSHGWATAIYSAGLWFINCSGTTEVWGDQELAVSAMSPYAYVSITNSDSGLSNYSTSTTMNSNRYCAASTPINSSYATSASHTGSLYANGSLDFSSSYNA